MDLMKLMKERYSCRRFEEKPVPREVIRTILEAGRVAPTAHRQVVVAGEAHLRTVAAMPAVDAVDVTVAAPFAYLVATVTRIPLLHNSDYKKKRQTPATGAPLCDRRCAR